MYHAFTMAHIVLTGVTRCDLPASCFLKATDFSINVGRDKTGIIPSFLAYSSFDSSNQTLYAVMVVLTTALQVISATVKWIREDKVCRFPPSFALSLQSNQSVSQLLKRPIKLSSRKAWIVHRKTRHKGATKT